MKADKKVWLITGASTGFGKELAKVVEEKGDLVVATFRKQAQVDNFTSLEKGKLGVLIDVTNTAQITSGVEKAINQFGKIDVLVNNAGYGSLGAIEEIPDAEVRKQFEVNVFGAINMVKAVLPTMRKQRSGHILNVTSIGGLIGFGASGIYNGSKFALEGIGHSLRIQLKPLGIHVTNIEPGPFRTDWAGRSATFVQSEIEDYKETVGSMLDGIKNLSGNQAGDPYLAAKAMYAITQVEHPPLLLPLGNAAFTNARKFYQEAIKSLDAFEYIGRPTDFVEE